MGMWLVWYLLDLGEFNRALLGKWLWRFGMEQSSLWVKVIGSKYGFLNGNWCSDDSYSKKCGTVWRNILRFKQRFEEGIQFKVYKGDCIKFWVDAWCSEEPLKTLFPDLFSAALKKDALALLSQLMFGNSLGLHQFPFLVGQSAGGGFRPLNFLEEWECGWLQGRFGASFWIGLVSAGFGRVQPCIVGKVALAFWYGTIFFVGKGSPLAADVWKFLGPPSVSFFGWAVCWGHSYGESIDHLLDFPKLYTRTSVKLGFCALEEERKIALEAVFDSFVFQFVLAFDLWEGWRIVCWEGVRREKIVQRWEAPPEGYLKINFDGSSLGNPGPAGIGGLARNSAGVVSWAFAGPIGRSDSSEAEVKAAFQGIHRLSKDMFDKVIVEGDSSNVISWLSGKIAPPWRFLSFFEEIADLVSASSIVFKFVRRSANGEADSLARSGVHKEGLEWFDHLPPGNKGKERFSYSASIEISIPTSLWHMDIIFLYDFRDRDKKQKLESGKERQAEVRALLFGIKWYSTHSSNPLIVEGDSSNVIVWASDNSKGP
ncbi:uncharacterized protein LOC143882203 [Tasmannia lanceolata]|uniref:uncharacterized protein LOC143882203 n=1 Tax=Tasmannia lanceolata TaxID=3420 RepID=UPI004064C8AF